MLKRAVNELDLTVEIEGHSHLLIKDGRYDKDVKKAWGGNDNWPMMMFICRNSADGHDRSIRRMLENGTYNELSYYLPGSSVRGAWRSHLEKVLRSLDENPKVCDPLIENGSGNSCSAELLREDSPAPDHPYRDSCPVCKLFGDAAQASRISISDGELRAGEPVIVDNIAIRRQTGSVAAPFKSLALRNARFELSVRLRNFELWQVGLLAHLFQDLATAGNVPLGSGKNKGFGSISARATHISVTYLGKADPMQDGRLRGIGDLTTESSMHYGFVRSEPPLIESESSDSKVLWRHSRRIIDITGFWTVTKGCFTEAIWQKFGGLETRRAAHA